MSIIVCNFQDKIIQMATYVDQSQQSKNFQGKFSNAPLDNPEILVDHGPENAVRDELEDSRAKMVIKAPTNQPSAQVAQQAQIVSVQYPPTNYQAYQPYPPAFDADGNQNLHDPPINYPVGSGLVYQPYKNDIAYSGVSPLDNSQIKDKIDGADSSDPEVDTSKWSLFKRLSERAGMKTMSNDRKSFIRKVYALLCCQLVFTAIFVGIVCAAPPLREGIKHTTAVVILCMVLTIAIMIGVSCNKKWSKRYPYNYYALALFTVFESYIVAFACSYYDQLVVLAAAVSTLVITVSLTIYAWKTKKDFTTVGGMMVITIMSLAMFGFFMIFLYDRVLYTIFCFIAVLLYGFFIVYDAQLIAGGRYQELSYDDYAIAALLMYIDIVGLFLYMLALLSNKNN
ncbi:unnamed protein product [Blepharisma stoltei]|uniref:Uncharacterized protein n=1 Tax=Blepharisma stoltei TaxID=1481888 RepID=A0AAU9J726_9CILI|nr:unnamed protein product [Blepharisma stoltei]